MFLPADQAVPMEAAITIAMASPCASVKPSDKTSQPARAPTAGSRLSKMLKLCLGKCLSANISKA